jgi:two-component system phosphate regulon sensor histidine kinase PhoR
MSKPIKKIGLFLILIILLPIIFLTYREFSSLNEDEKILEKIYKNQLDVILFSVNQYSEDMVRSGSFRLQSIIENYQSDKKSLNEKLNSFYNENPVVKLVFISDSSLAVNHTYVNAGNGIIFEKDDQEVKLVLDKNYKLISRLYVYKSMGFTKIEPLNSTEIKGKQIFVFVLDDKRLCGIVINPRDFVRKVLASKIQSVAGQELNIAVFDSVKNVSIYSTGNTGTEYQQSKHLWMIPDYSLGISLRGATIDSLIKERTYTNMILIAGLTVLMLLVTLYGYKNIKKEVELAQIKSDFVSNVSHELRTPLALISMFAETLVMGRVKSDEKQNEYYNIIHQETERLSKIVNKILSFSKIEAGKWKFRFSKEDLNSIVEKIYCNYKFHLQKNGFEFSFEPASEILESNFDPETVTEAVINLIDNAVK